MEKIDLDEIDKKLESAQNLMRMGVKTLFGMAKIMIKSYAFYLVYIFIFFTIYYVSGFEVTVILLLVGILRGFNIANKRT